METPCLRNRLGGGIPQGGKAEIPEIHGLVALRTYALSKLPINAPRTTIMRAFDNLDRNRKIVDFPLKGRRVEKEPMPDRRNEGIRVYATLRVKFHYTIPQNL